MVAEPWWSSWVGPVAPYAVLLRLFVDRRLTADEFELVFLRLYKLDPTAWPPELFDVLDTLAESLAARIAPLQVDVVAGLPTLGLTLAAAVAGKLGHRRYVPLGTFGSYRDAWGRTVYLGPNRQPAFVAQNGQLLPYGTGTGTYAMAPSFDQDGDGVPNRYDRYPDDARYR